MVRAAMYENTSLIVVTIDGQCHISQILKFVWSAVVSLLWLHYANDMEPVWQNNEKLYQLRSGVSADGAVRYGRHKKPGTKSSCIDFPTLLTYVSIL